MRLRAFPSFSFVPAAGVETQPEIDSTQNVLGSESYFFHLMPVPQRRRSTLQ